MNKRGTWGDAFFILLVIFMILLIVLAATFIHQRDTGRCTKICTRKGYDFYKIGPRYMKCECLSSEGDIVLVNR